MSRNIQLCMIFLEDEWQDYKYRLEMGNLIDMRLK